MASLIYLMCGHDPRSIVQHHQGQKPQCKDTCPSFPKRSTSLAAPLPLEVWGIWDWAGILFFFFFSFPFFLIYFLLKDNCYTEFCCFLLNLNMNQPSVQFSSVAQSCPTLCDPMNHSTPGLPVHHQLLEFTQTHVHWVGDAIQPSHPLSSPSPPAPNPSQHQGLFQWVNSSQEVAKVLEFQLQDQSFQWTPRTDFL